MQNFTSGSRLQSHTHWNKAESVKHVLAFEVGTITFIFTNAFSVLSAGNFHINSLFLNIDLRVPKVSRCLCYRDLIINSCFSITSISHFFLACTFRTEKKCWLCWLKLFSPSNMCLEEQLRTIYKLFQWRLSTETWMVIGVSVQTSRELEVSLSSFWEST